MPGCALALWLSATLCTRRNACRRPCGGGTVTGHTPADIRVEHPQFLDGLPTHSVALLRESGRVDLDRVPRDDVRAGAASFRRRPRRGSLPGVGRPCGAFPGRVRRVYWGKAGGRPAQGSA